MPLYGSRLRTLIRAHIPDDRLERIAEKARAGSVVELDVALSVDRDNAIDDGVDYRVEQVLKFFIACLDALLHRAASRDVMRDLAEASQLSSLGLKGADHNTVYELRAVLAHPESDFVNVPFCVADSSALAGLPAAVSSLVSLVYKDKWRPMTSSARYALTRSAAAFQVRILRDRSNMKIAWSETPSKNSCYSNSLLSGRVGGQISLLHVRRLAVSTT